MKIVVPTDFSKNAFKALNYCIETFGNIATEFIILHTKYIHHSLIEIPATTKDSWHKFAQKELNLLKIKVQLSFPEVKGKIKTLYAIGDISHVLRELEEHKGFDLIAMGTKGASNKFDQFIGTRTSHVITSLRKPILVVPENCNISQAKNVLYSLVHDKNTIY